MAFPEAIGSSREYIKGDLHGLFIAKYSIYDAYMTIQEMNGGDSWTHLDVLQFFKTLSSTKPSEKIEGEHGLLQMPYPIPKIIVNHLDLTSRLSFFDTRKIFRDITSPCHLKEVTIEYCENCIEIKTDEGFCREYMKFNNGCIIQQGDKHRWDKETSYWRAAEKDLKTILSQKMFSIGKLKIEQYGENDAKEAEDMLIRTLFLNQLKIRSIFVGHAENGFSEFLKNFQSDPTYLKTVIFHNDGRKSLDIGDDFFASPHFKNLDCLFLAVPGLKFNEHHLVDSLPLIPKTMIFLNQDITLDTILRIKDKLLQNVKLVEMKFGMENKEVVLADFKRQLLFGSKDSIHFDYPNQKGKRLTLTIKDATIWFKGPEYDETALLCDHWFAFWSFEFEEEDVEEVVEEVVEEIVEEIVEE